MVEQARLFNLLAEYVNQDQPQAPDSMLPLSQLPMNLRKEERASRGNKRVLSEIDVSEWEITCKETRPREGKRRCDTGKATQLPVGGTLSQAARLRKKRRRSSALSRKTDNKFPSPETFHPVFATIVDNPGISYIIAQISSIRIRTSEQLTVLTARTRFFKGSQTNLTLWVTSLSKNHFPTSS
jgi:hypothetical protein